MDTDIHDAMLTQSDEKYDDDLFLRFLKRDIPIEIRL
ncbi:hypothetical protein Ct9H90mP29_10080 [bacterium]|nr:MAG: hypothetical protein Ct9H90mP29_10080 [bacterium]